MRPTQPQDVTASAYVQVANHSADAPGNASSEKW